MLGRKQEVDTSRRAMGSELAITLLLLGWSWSTAIVSLWHGPSGTSRMRPGEAAKHLCWHPAQCLSDGRCLRFPICIEAAGWATVSSQLYQPHFTWGPSPFPPPTLDQESGTAWWGRDGAPGPSCVTAIKRTNQLITSKLASHLYIEQI